MTAKIVTHSSACADQCRHHHTYFPSSSSPKDYTAYSSCDSSTIASLFWHFSPPFTSTNEESGPSEALPGRSASESR